MSALDDLIKEIPDANLRNRINTEFSKLKAVKKFGLVFEEQKPEVTPLYDMPIKVSTPVVKKLGRMNQIYRVQKIEGDDVICTKYIPTDEIFSFKLNQLVRVALFGDPIYPYLQKLDSVCNAPDSDLWHTLIEADNYHALQMLQYVCKDKKVDCIYIDPPYNTGAKDWKYNNDYVDGADEYRHSKWLSMMQKRLLLAKQILNPADSVLIVTVDEKEYLHLGCLLEEIFPEAKIQMISSVINPAGVSRTREFSRVEEYIFFLIIGKAYPHETFDNMLDLESKDTNFKSSENLWLSLRRAGTGSLRQDRPNLFYPIYVDTMTGKITGYGDFLPNNIHVHEENSLNDEDEKIINVYPIKSNGEEGRWQLQGSTLMKGVEEGTVKAEYSNQKKKWIIKYLNEGTKKEIFAGHLIITGKDENGAILIERQSEKLVSPKTVWNRKRHNATTFGTNLLNSVIGSGKFAFPKSLYAVRDCLKFFVANKPDALIVDFFAGSGTTLHAVNLLNAEDGGKRRCILVTNNEVAESEEKNLRKQGYQPNDEEWQKLGVARYVTWQRTVCSIKGENIKGEPLTGNYLGSEIPMADGFKSNAIFFKLGFLNKNAVALGRQFKEILPVIWLKAGSYGTCPNLDDEENLPPMLVLPENKFAVLLEEEYFMEFEEKVLELSEIETVFIVTDSLDAYRQMIQNLRDRKTYQLYRDYLENFKINIAP